MSEFKHVPANIQAFMRFFKWEHLPTPLQPRSAVFQQLATTVLHQADLIVDGGGDVDWAEVMVGLRNLLTAKDNIVRAFLPM